MSLPLSNNPFAADKVPSYAGIGSRRTPAPVLALMRRIAKRLAERGLLLRSGAADGADKAFEAGCDDAGGAKQIWLPWAGFNGSTSHLCSPTPAAFKIAAAHHPNWSACAEAARKLHARNAHQVLGPDLTDPVDFVVCFTPDGCESAETRTLRTGGTGMAIAIASTHGVPVVNLANHGALSRVADILDGRINAAKANDLAVAQAS